MAYNFGYEFRQAWWQNYFFAALVTLFTSLHFYATLTVSKLSCVWRVNCIDQNVVDSITFSKTPIQNIFNTTVMPEYYRLGLIGIMTGNAVAVCAWDYLVVNGMRRYFAARKRLHRRKGSEHSLSGSSKAQPDVGKDLTERTLLQTLRSVTQRFLVNISRNGICSRFWEVPLTEALLHRNDQHQILPSSFSS